MSAKLINVEDGTILWIGTRFRQARNRTLLPSWAPALGAAAARRWVAGHRRPAHRRSDRRQGPAVWRAMRCPRSEEAGEEGRGQGGQGLPLQTPPGQPAEVAAEESGFAAIRAGGEQFLRPCAFVSVKGGVNS